MGGLSSWEEHLGATKESKKFHYKVSKNPLILNSENKFYSRIILWLFDVWYFHELNLILRYYEEDTSRIGQEIPTHIKYANILSLSPHDVSQVLTRCWDRGPVSLPHIWRRWTWGQAGVASIHLHNGKSRVCSSIKM